MSIQKLPLESGNFWN